ncbi:MAG: N-6 DNA methylase [Saprospiraceae bacterium]|nr:N-6 DNA methylase [Saprospiraceae bacterium]MCF8248513.1 N-6 DNA methylase [Saprospiraceae bacterium]MCF8280584.1 N-6 DNA methylase [Bacteroidales bacterium]MCF8310247.1 N-6 DNA methylase [Saprospiraceae bacterium]MCF8439314.1 N-6 DNA methylase [Saprospiraceae bacterium]
MELFFGTNKLPASERKLRGGYYTPNKLAAYLVDWAVRFDTKRILEPSCGDGNFVVPIIERLKKLKKIDASLTAVELETDELLSAQKKVHDSDIIDWRFGDFFNHYAELSKDKRFDVVLGNPPFIRFQHIENTSRDIAFSHLRKSGYKPTKLANIWSAFVQLSIELLKEGGRMGFVLPAELLQVNYAEELRNKLVSSFENVLIIGFKKLVFPDIQQEVVLLLAEGKRSEKGFISDIHTLELEDGEELIRTINLDNAVRHLPVKHTHTGMKWTSLFMSDEKFSVLEKVAQNPLLTSLGKIASIDVGLVTGRNSFFVIHEKRMEALGAIDFTIPIVGRTSGLKSVVFNSQDFEKYRLIHPSYLLNFNQRRTEEIPKDLLKYIASGEKEEVNKGYKCRIRKRWFDVPSIYVPDGFLFRQIHKYPLMVVNEIGATSTDTVHRVRMKNGNSPHKLASVFFNSLTLAWAEVAGRSYGGGVLELEPNEAEKLLIPWKEDMDIDISIVDNLLRNGKEIEALDYVDTIVLEQFLGLTRKEVLDVRGAWQELRDRRINRK